MKPRNSKMSLPTIAEEVISFCPLASSRHKAHASKYHGYIDRVKMTVTYSDNIHSHPLPKFFVEE